MAVSQHEIEEMAKGFAAQQVSYYINELLRDNHEFRMTSQERSRAREAMKYYETVIKDIEKGRIEK